MSRLIYMLKRVFQALSMRLLYRKGLQPNAANGATLFWVPGGMPLMLDLEGAIAAALKLRGRKVHAIICDGVFTACIRREITDQIPINEWRKSCDTCRRACARALDIKGISYSYIGDYISEKKLSDLRDIAEAVSWESMKELKYKEIAVGMNVKSAILRFLKGHDFPGDPSLVREYAFSGLVCAAASERAIDELSPARIFMSHGVYADWGPALHTALAKNIPITGWMASYLPTHFYIRHVPDGVHIDFHNISKSAWSEARNATFTAQKIVRLEQYLLDRYQRDTSFDMKRFKQFTGHVNNLRVAYGIEPSKPVWGIMAHINWDTVSDYAPMLYETFNEWMLDTIQTIRDIPDVQWLIKVHPAEAWDNPDSGVEALIRNHFPDLPENIRVLPAEENVNPLDFFSLVDGGVTVYGTAGLELALHGKPIILAGDAHYGGKGFTLDADSQDSYRALLKQAGRIESLSEEQIDLVRKYAYCYFIQRQIPIAVVEDPNSKWWSFQFDKRELLLEGRDPAIDFVCEKILDGTDFIMDEQLLSIAEKNMIGRV